MTTSQPHDNNGGITVDTYTTSDHYPEAKSWTISPNGHLNVHGPENRHLGAYGSGHWASIRHTTAATHTDTRDPLPALPPHTDNQPVPVVIVEPSTQ
jgi:hypothetical protein